MTVNLTCTQVGALLSFYIDDKLNEQLEQFVNAHLEACPTCRAKLEALRTMVAGLREVHSKLRDVKLNDENETCKNTLYDEFKINLSAYVDNELEDDENIKVKKYIISNQKARKELEGMYDLKKILHESFEKSKHDAKTDFSKYILKRIDIQEELYGQDSFAKVVALFLIIFAVFGVTAMLIFWI